MKKPLYTIAEAAAILGVGDDTFTRWRRFYQIPTEKTDTDQRLTLIKREDIERLGQIKHWLPNWAIIDAPAKPAGTRRDRTLASALMELAATQDELRDALAALQQRVDQEPTRPALDPTTPFTRHQPPRFADVPSRTVAPKETNLTPMPPGWLAWQRMAREHGIPKTSGERARDTGQFPVERITRGMWQQEDGSHCVEALTPDGQTLFHAWATTRSQFTPVPGCPYCANLPMVQATLSVAAQPE